MKLSTKTRYGTRALVDLVLHSQGNSPVPLKDIAERQEFSLNYLEHIITPLITAGIVKSVRGVKGGILLAKPAQKISLQEVVELLEGPITPVECLVNARTCPRSSLCATQDIWGELNAAISNVLSSTTLQDLADRQREKSTTGMYFI